MIKTKKGINFYDYHLILESNYKDAFTQSLWNEKDSAKPDYLPEMAENGKYYLIPGKYNVEFTVNGKTVKKNLEVKERK
jgi:hypothetical protein